MSALCTIDGCEFAIRPGNRIRYVDDRTHHADHRRCDRKDDRG